jgi:myo-inositol 2-dehydrogenase / D-chiro-inositol 1-dehydrogenase
MIRLAMIGCGEHAEGAHAIQLARYKAEHPEALELTAVCDLRLDRAQLFCSQYGFQNAYTDMRHMLAEHSVDACVAVVPVEKIPEVGIWLLEQRIPCVIEKPLGASLADVRALRQVASQTGTPNMVSVNRRFMPFLNRALEWSRTLGPLRYVRCTFARHARIEPEFLWGTAVHAVDALRYLAGDVLDAHIRDLKYDGTVRWYAIDLNFASGVAGRIDVLPTAGMLEETYELIGEGFRALVTCPFGPRRGWRGFRENRVVVEEYESAESTADVLQGFYDETAAFLQILGAKQDLRPSIEDVFPSVELCFELAKAAAERDASMATTKS